MLFFRFSLLYPCITTNDLDLNFKADLLLSLNGLLIFFLEMPIVSISQRKNIDKLKIILWGTFLMSISFYVLMIKPALESQDGVFRALVAGAGGSAHQAATASAGAGSVRCA